MRNWILFKLTTDDPWGVGKFSVMIQPSSEETVKGFPSPDVSTWHFNIRNAILTPNRMSILKLFLNAWSVNLKSLKVSDQEESKLTWGSLQIILFST